MDGIIRDERVEFAEAGVDQPGRGQMRRDGFGVFSPCPVMQSTTDSFAGILPVAMSFFAQATVTPPAVSEKMPSVSASSRMPSMISSSEASSHEPPLDLIELTA